MPLPTLENSVTLINGQADHCYVTEEDMFVFFFSSIHETKINNDLNIISLSQVEAFY